MTNQQAPEALRLADWLQNAVATYPQVSEDEPGGYCQEVDQVMDEAAAELRRLHAENERLSGLCDKWNSECDEFREDNKRLAALVEAQQPAPSAAADLHPKTADLVKRFAAALADKLAAAENKYGYSEGWASPDWMDECRLCLREHLFKGDPRDVAAYCAFLWHHGESTALPSEVVEDRVKEFEQLFPARKSPTPQADSQPAPIDMVLHCPKCGVQHIDASEPPVEFEPGAAQWSNPPHRSHLCHGCGHIWRPADVPTNGVEAVKTTGKADSPIAARAPADSVTAPAGGVVAGPVVGYRVSDPHEPDLGHWLSEEPGAAWCVSEPLALAAPTPPAQAADSVLEDAAPQVAIDNPYSSMTARHEAFEQGVLKTLAAFRAKHAARKQGGA